MYRAKDEIVYRNLKLILSQNSIDLKDMSFFLDIPYKTLWSLKRRNTRIEEKYGRRLCSFLGMSEERLFHELLYKEELHMYFNGTHLKKIQDEYYGSLPLGRIDHMACALHMICRLIGNSPIKIYVNYSGWVMIDENSVEENRPKRGERGSASIIRIDRSSSVKDYEGQERSFRERNDSYEKEVELIRYLADRINLFFPCIKGSARYKKILVHNFIYRRNHEQMKKHLDYEQGYRQFLADKRVTERLAYDAFGLWDEEKMKRVYSHLNIKDGETRIDDLSEKLRLFRKHKEDTDEQRSTQP